MRSDPGLIFADHGISGTALARPQLAALRAKAAAGEIAHLLILNPARVVWAMLRNPAYTGQAAYRKTKVVARNRPTKHARDHTFSPTHVPSSTRDRPQEDWLRIPVPALRSEAVSQRAHERREANKRFSPRNNQRSEYLLRGLLRCAHWGYAPYGKPASNSKYKRLYDRCAGQDGHRWKDGRVGAAHPVRVEARDDLVRAQTCKL